MRRPAFLTNVKIDWPNHIIGFFSALFGILIAFQLDEWKDSNRELRLAREAFLLIKNESNQNKNMFFSLVETNEGCLASVTSILPYLNEQLHFTGSYKVADSVNRANAFITIRTDSTLTDKKHIDVPVLIAMDRLQAPVMHSSAWESAKATGALNFMNIEKVDLLSLIYNDLRLSDELNDFRHALKKSDDVKNRSEFISILTEIDKSHRIIRREAVTYESYVNILNALE